MRLEESERSIGLQSSKGDQILDSLSFKADGVVHTAHTDMAARLLMR